MSAAPDLLAASVEERLRAVVERETGRAGPLCLTAKLAEEVAQDSLSRLALVMAVENEFSICLADEEAAGLSSVHDLVQLIERSMAAREAGLRG